MNTTEKQKIIIFGTGSRMKKVMKSFDERFFNIVAYVDNDRKKWGSSLQGINIIAPSEIKKKKYDKIVICSTAFELIKEQLIELGINEGALENHLYFMKENIRKKYIGCEINSELKDVLSYINSHGLSIFNYPFIENYKEMNISIELDKDAQLYYVLHKQKRLYMKRSFDNKEKIRKYYEGLCLEQDAKSPHCYFTDGFEVETGDIVVDAGVAEGNFAIEVIEKVSKIYLIECDEDWVEALQWTFKDYMDKVVIIKKFLSNNTSGESVTIDDVIQEEKINYIKMDIEGEELNALKGAKNLIKRSETIKINVCTYHKETDEKEIKTYLENLGVITHATSGYMCFYNDPENTSQINYRIEPTPFVRGLLQGRKSKLIIFGTGDSSKVVEDSLNKEKINIQCYVDNNIEKQETIYNNRKVISPLKIDSIEYDYIIIAIVNYKSVLEQLEELNINRERIIVYFDEHRTNSEQYENIFNINKWILKSALQRAEVELLKIKKDLQVKFDNIEYEIADKIQNKTFLFPHIKSAEEAIGSIIKNHYSLCRFGDGEFEMMRGNKRPKFQLPDKQLAKRLKEILKNDDDNILMAIANNYGSLDTYTEEAANGIRKYMTPEVRKYHMGALEQNKVYYDAYLSRPYIIYRDKENAKERFNLLKQIWDERNVTIVEGDRTKMGIGNDLFHNAKRIQRIIAPNENAFSKYERILEAAKKINKNELILIALGPTATVLAYDLAKEGYQAIDIGHVDIEYEWFLRKTDRKIPIKGKYVNEVKGGEDVNKDDINSEKEIIEIIFD